jgi:putative transposase
LKILAIVIYASLLAFFQQVA